MKTCIYCGETKDINNFRPYYNRKTGHYTYCRSCEQIEKRRKYLIRKVELTDVETVELMKINKLYEVRRRAGLQSPGQARFGVLDQVNQEIARLTSSKDPD